MVVQGVVVVMIRQLLPEYDLLAILAHHHVLLVAALVGVVQLPLLPDIGQQHQQLGKDLLETVAQHLFAVVVVLLRGQDPVSEQVRVILELLYGLVVVQHGHEPLYQVLVPGLEVVGGTVVHGGGRYGVTLAAAGRESQIIGDAQTGKGAGREARGRLDVETRRRLHLAQGREVTGDAARFPWVGQCADLQFRTLLHEPVLLVGFVIVEAVVTFGGRALVSSVILRRSGRFGFVHLAVCFVPLGLFVGVGFQTSLVLLLLIFILKIAVVENFEILQSILQLGLSVLNVRRLRLAFLAVVVSRTRIAAL